MPNIIYGSLPKPNRVSTFYRISLFRKYIWLICVYSAIHTSKMLFTHQFTHQTIKIFDSINVLIRSNYINKYIFQILIHCIWLWTSLLILNNICLMIYEVKSIIPLTRPVLYCSLSVFAALVKFYHIYKQFKGTDPFWGHDFLIMDRFKRNLHSICKIKF